MNNTENLLEIQDLSVEFRTDDGVVKAVNHMNLQLQRGKTLGLVGETGAGKTTTALSILRLIPDPPGVITGGSIRLGDTDILAAGKREMEKLRGSQVSMIFQDPMTSLNPVYTIGNQIVEVIRLHTKKNKQEAWARAEELLEGYEAALGCIARDRRLESALDTITQNAQALASVPGAAPQAGAILRAVREIKE